MGKKDHKYCSKCIFCLCKCPECGSNDIEIQYIINHLIDNFEEDILTIEPEYYYCQLVCRNCGERVLPGDSRLKELDKIFEQLVPNTLEATIKNGKIDFMEYEVVADNWLNEN